MPSGGGNGGGSSRSSSRVMPNLPAGFRFHPTDEELMVHYLMRQAAALPCPVPIIAEVNIYQCNPWDLPAKALFGDKEWFFFSPRDRKYPNGARPNRAAGSGYWKATGTDKAILSSSSTPTSHGGANVVVGVKKALVFYGGRPPKGSKTDWIMHEYRLTVDDDGKSSTKRRGSSSSPSSSMRLDDWVLCRIHKKSNDFQLSSSTDDHEQEQEEPAGGSATTVEELDALVLVDNSSNTTNDSSETAPLLSPETMMMSKSCSLTDLLNSIDYAALSSQMLLLDAAPADPPLIVYPPATHQQALANNTNNNDYYDDSLLPTSAAVDAAAVLLSSSPADTNGVKKRKRVTAVDYGAAEPSFHLYDGGNSSGTKKLKLPPSDSRYGGHFGTATASSYRDNQLQQQQQLVHSASSSSSNSSGGFFHQYGYSSLLLSSSSNNPFLNLNQQQLLLNSHIGMQ